MPKRKSYTVLVNATSLQLSKMGYPDRYFPRKFHYLKDAKSCAQEVVDKGASLARIEYPDGAEHDFRPQKR